MISAKFYLFVIVIIAIQRVIKNRDVRIAWLTVASYAIIGYLDYHALIVTVFLSLYAYMGGMMIDARRWKHSHTWAVTGIVVLLVVFKYLGMLTSTIASIAGALNHPLDMNLTKIAVPLGLSYTVFRFISYLTDIHWKIHKSGRLLDVLCFGSLFTIFTAGPIERFSHLAP